MIRTCLCSELLYVIFLDVIQRVAPHHPRFFNPLNTIFHPRLREIIMGSQKISYKKSKSFVSKSSSSSILHTITNNCINILCLISQKFSVSVVTLTGIFPLVSILPHPPPIIKTSPPSWRQLTHSYTPLIVMKRVYHH